MTRQGRFPAASSDFDGTRLNVAGASSSALSLAFLTVLSAVIARAMLANFPTLGGALVAVATLLVLEGLLGRLHAVMRLRRRAHRPRVVMVDGEFVPARLRHLKIGEVDLVDGLRAAGVRRMEDVALAILEPRGTLTLIRVGQSIDDTLLAGLVGAESARRHVNHPEGKMAERENACVK